MTDHHPKDPILEGLGRRVAELEEHLVKHEEDLRDAAGALFVDLPKPGTDAAKMLRVIRRLREDIAAEEAVSERLMQELNEINGPIHMGEPVLPPHTNRGMALVPREITAESGHKAGMIGDFTERWMDHCPFCYGSGLLEDDGEECEACEGSGVEHHTKDVSWTTIKDIHKRIVEIAELDRQEGRSMTIDMESRVTMAARIAHEVNRAYCQALGDTSQPAWEDAPWWQRDSAIAGAEFHQANPDAGPEASHNSWSAQKLNDGWRWGEVKDPEAKTHPCLVAFESLPVEQQAKDYLFRAVVHAVLGGGHA